MAQSTAIHVDPEDTDGPRRPRGRPPGLTYEIVDGQRHRAMTRTHERILNRELQAIRAKEAKERSTDPTWMLPNDLYKRLATIQKWLVKIPPARALNQKQLEAAQAQTPIEQLEAQFRAELELAAAAWSEDDWARLDALRAQRFPGKWTKETM